MKNREEVVCIGSRRSQLYNISGNISGYSAADGSVLSLPFSSMDQPPPVLEVQITQIDYSLNAPNSLDNTSLPKVPVLRIYGASSVGKKCCLHIHQVYPYFFVEYTGKISPGSGEQSIECFRPRQVD